MIPRVFFFGNISGIRLNVESNILAEYTDKTSAEIGFKPLAVEVHSGRKWTSIGDPFGGVLLLDCAVIKQIKISDLDLVNLHDITIINIAPSVLKKQTPPSYKALIPIIGLHAEKQDYPVGLGMVSDFRLVIGNFLKPKIAFTYSNVGGWFFSPMELLYVARRYNWSGLRFRPADFPPFMNGGWSIDYLSKDWPPKWWPDGYEPHPSNVMEGEVPDIKVGEGLVGEFAPPPKTTSPKRKPIDPKLPLIDPAAIRRVKLEEDDSDGWSAEIPLNRPLYDSETLTISLSQEDDDCPLTLAQAHKQIRAALGLLEKSLPQIEARLRAEMGPHKLDYEAFLKTLHSPSLFFQAEQMLAGPKWGFSVEDDLYDFQFDFEGDQLVDFCPVC